MRLEGVGNDLSCKDRCGGGGISGTHIEISEEFVRLLRMEELNIAGGMRRNVNREHQLSNIVFLGDQIDQHHQGRRKPSAHTMLWSFLIKVPPPD